jgi:acetoin utilization protein AcuB
MAGRMNVRAIMTKTVVSASPTMSVHDAIQLLDDSDIRHLPIVEDGKLVGIVSDRDLRAYQRSDELLQTRVGEIMQQEPLCMEVGESLAAVIDVMLEYKIGALPVVGEERELVGIVSYIDVLRHVRPLVSLE